MGHFYPLRHTVYNHSLRIKTHLMESLTPRQKEIFEWICQYKQTQGLPPTRMALCTAMGFHSPNAAESHLRALARKGVIELLPGASRGIRILTQPDHPEGLPLIGRVAAGEPILAQQHIESYYPIGAELFHPRAHYLLRVQGDSMSHAGILSDDLLAVHQTANVSNGQIVVARIHEEVTVKRYFRHLNQVELRPENPAFSIMTIDLTQTPLHIEGRMVGLIRSSWHS